MNVAGVQMQTSSSGQMNTTMWDYTAGGCIDGSQIVFIDSFLSDLAFASFLLSAVNL